MPYYLYDGKQSVGPFEIADLVKRPDFGAATLVFPVGATGADAWKPAGSVPELAAALKPVAPPPPPPPPVQARPAEISLNIPEATHAEWGPKSTPAPSASAPAPAEEFAPRWAAPEEKLILVVDDDENVRGFIEASATMQGFQVVTAVNGIDATAKLAARTPDLIITDLMMPGQSGYEFLRSLQGGGSGRIPVFIITGSSLDKSTIALIRQEANVAEFLSKPLTMGKLVTTLHAHLGTAPKA